jgi:hypothetical protein
MFQSLTKKNRNDRFCTLRSPNRLQFLYKAERNCLGKHVALGNLPVIITFYSRGRDPIRIKRFSESKKFLWRKFEARKQPKLIAAASYNP